MVTEAISANDVSGYRSGVVFEGKTDLQIAVKPLSPSCPTLHAATQTG
jgi:hypothetical protein|tara:strand:+ start:2066 stop:2209 length:144 start_codon:yes stop_codon:yes gene_type:complete